MSFFSNNSNNNHGGNRSNGSGGNGSRRGGGNNNGRNSFADRLDTRSNNNSHSNYNNNEVKVEFRNWQAGSRDNLVDFIFKKTRIPLNNVRVSGPVLHAVVNKTDSRVLAKYNGIRFAGSSLDIRVLDSENNNNNGGGQSSETRHTIQLLDDYLNNHYNADLKLLNLDNMPNDPFLVSNGLFSSESTQSKIFPALMKIAENRLSTVESVSLGSNGLSNVSVVTTLAATYPRLKNLSLANNNISNIDALDPWRHKFTHLRELILSGNPITASPTYQPDILKLFPRLVVLDGQVIRDESQLDLIRMPVSIRHNFSENNEIGNIAGNFLATFFELYDRDRSQLMQLYDDQSTFSLNLNSNSLRQLGGTGGMQHSNTNDWSAYIPLSRNLFKITSSNGRLSRLSVGPQSIAHVFQRLPPTQHDLKAPEKFSVDIWNVKDIRTVGDQAIMIYVHGEFLEQNNNKRSFDRSLVLLPGPTGNMIVTSDMLTIRPYSGFDSWKESPNGNNGDINSNNNNTQSLASSSIQPSVSGSTTPNGILNLQQQQQPPAPQLQPIQPTNAQIPALTVPPSIVNTELIKHLSPAQQLVVRTLIEKTRLTTNYALMCAEQAQFNLQQALQLFEQSKAQNLIPPEAFIV